MTLSVMYFDALNLSVGQNFGLGKFSSPVKLPLKTATSKVESPGSGGKIVGAMRTFMVIEERSSDVAILNLLSQ